MVQVRDKVPTNRILAYTFILRERQKDYRVKVHLLDMLQKLQPIQRKAKDISHPRRRLS